MPLVDVIASLSTGTYSVRRQESGSYDTSGRWVVGPTALVVADDVVESVDASTDTFTLTSHGLETADGPLQLTTDDTLPSGLALTTDYWAIVVDANNIKLAASLAAAIAETAVDITDAGVGTHTVVDTSETTRQNATFFSAIMSVQPATGKQLQQLPEGEHCDDVWSVWSPIELRSRTEDNEPDEIFNEGERYYVKQVKVRRGFGGVHWQCLASRRKEENP